MAEILSPVNIVHFTRAREINDPSQLNTMVRVTLKR